MQAKTDVEMKVLPQTAIFICFLIKLIWIKLRYPLRMEHFPFRSVTYFCF